MDSSALLVKRRFPAVVAILAAAAVGTTGCVQTGGTGSAFDAAQGVVAQRAESVSEQLLLATAETDREPIAPDDLLRLNAVYYVALNPDEQADLVNESNADTTLYELSSNDDQVTASVYLPGDGKSQVGFATSTKSVYACGAIRVDKSTKTASMHDRECPEVFTSWRGQSAEQVSMTEAVNTLNEERGER